MTLKQFNYLLEQVDAEIARQLRVAFTTLDEEVRELRREVDDLERELACAQDDLSSAESEITRLEKQLEDDNGSKA